MTGKPFHILFAFLFFLLISFARSEIDVNPRLELEISCSSSNPCSMRGAFCNSAGKCQCGLGQIPKGTDNHCYTHNCESSDSLCFEVYKDPYARCSGYCRCPRGFQLNANTQKCELEKPTSRLGRSCNVDHQCGYAAKCSTAGECRCPAGYIPETKYTCKEASCSSTEFCHTNVTANTVCNSDGYCECQEPIFKEDPETFACVRVRPDPLPLGTRCKDSIYCGEGARCTTGSEPICKCKLGYLATSDTGCEQIRCSKDEQCHKRVSPLTSCYDKGEKDSYCDCKSGYQENPATHECSPGEEPTTEGPDVCELCRREDKRIYHSLWQKCEAERLSDKSRTSANVN